ncbi:kirola-like [Vigna radiata var. radiata]|uniref:Kirola-like n=1 Tax=Vigna radiata var. radiata TaxID=3916 RepID=A0A1S3TAR5_VIGRR|nr:kirola-like [Vigna radiata var. radiata]
MSLTGKLIIEIGVHATAAKWFNLLATQLHHVQNLTDAVLEIKAWHHNESINQWTSTIDGKATKYLESVESADEDNKTITYKIFGEDFEHKFKVFKLIFQAIDKDEGGGVIKWIIEYETKSEEFDPPFGFLEFVYKGSRDVDANLIKA